MDESKNGGILLEPWVVLGDSLIEPWSWSLGFQFNLMPSCEWLHIHYFARFFKQVKCCGSLFDAGSRQPHRPMSLRGYLQAIGFNDKAHSFFVGVLTCGVPMWGGRGCCHGAPRWWNHNSPGLILQKVTKGEARGWEGQRKTPTHPYTEKHVRGCWRRLCAMCMNNTEEGCMCVEGGLFVVYNSPNEQA